jgi:hypothetical protein
MTQTKKTLFNVIDDITWKKTPLSEYSEEDKKSISSYMINRYLSMRIELIEIINELQTYTIGLLRPKDTYRLYHDVLPANKSFAKYIKGKKDDKYSDKLISQVAEHYKVSKSEATDYVDLLNQDSCTRLLSLYGYTDAEIKTMCKGVRK